MYLKLLHNTEVFRIPPKKIFINDYQHTLLWFILTVASPWFITQILVFLDYPVIYQLQTVYIDKKQYTMNLTFGWRVFRYLKRQRGFDQ